MSLFRDYGTTDGQAHEQEPSPHETEALLPQHKPERRSSFVIRSWALSPVVKARGDLALLACYFVTGLLDSSATVLWGAFVSMQTGNSIYLGLGLVAPAESNRWIKSALSLASFALGSFLFSRYHRLNGGHTRRRGLLVSSLAAQVALTIAAASVLRVTPTPAPGDAHDLHWHVLLPLALVALQSGGQTALSRALQFNSLTSTVLTSIYCDLFSDPGLFAAPTQNVERNRRFAAPICLVAGAAVGGAWAKTEIGVEAALWTAAAVKLAVTVAYAFWKGEPDSDERNQNEQ